MAVLALVVPWRPVAGVSQMPAAAPSALRFSGDFRIRYEHTSHGNGAPSLGKEVFRFRLGLAYPLRENLVARVRVATGSAGDPNSTDVTLGSFVDDVPVSLDVASIELTRPHWALFGGKFVNPLLSTELVWDGDVNPQGVAGRLMLGNKTGASATMTGLYFIVDAQPHDSSSNMTGGQLALSAPVARGARVTAAAGYYDYQIRSLVNADGGDIRGNRLQPGGGAYLSDFDLLDALVTLDWAEFGERLPAHLVGEYVRNLGASGPNTGWGADLYLGRTQKPGDARFHYGYAQVETDAILAAFAHDNTSLGTNSETHTISLDAVPMPGMLLNATVYVYRPHQAAAGVRREYQRRLRLNAMMSF